MGDKAFWYPPELPDDKETTLILAGDLWIGTKFIEWAGFSWIGKVAPKFKQVLIVLGNHDFWPQGTLTIKNGADKCNAMLQDHGLHNVHVLDMSTYVDGDYLFVGATLWTDMNQAEPMAMYNMSNFMAYDGKIAFETGPNGAYTKFTSDRWVQTFYKHRDYIKHVVEQNRDKKVVVITHHLPLTTVSDPVYNGDKSNAYYMSDLSNIMLDNPHIKLWFHGHSHYQHETMFNETLIINNAVGYTSEHMEQQELVKHKTIEI